MDTPILDIRGTDILEDLSFRRHSFSPTLMKRVEDRRRFTQFWQASNSEGSLPFRERSASSRSAPTRVKQEDEITAPVGREIAVPPRHALTTGRGTARNAVSSEDSRRLEAARALLAQEQKVLVQHKAKSTPDYKTGRGGAGAKGHVKVRGRVPNMEAALAKEREVQYRWNLEKNLKRDMKTGRGGSGNIFKTSRSRDGERRSSNSFDISERGPSTSRSESRRENTPQVVRESRYTYGFGYAPTIRSRPQSISDQRAEDDHDIPPVPAQDINTESRITTSVNHPTAPSPSYTHSYRTLIPVAATPSFVKKKKGRIPNEVAPFEEPDLVGPIRSDNHQPRVQGDRAGDDSKSLLKSLKRLRVGKAKENKRSTRRSLVPERASINITHMQRDPVADARLSVIEPHHTMEMPSTSAASQTNSPPYLGHARTQYGVAFSHQYTGTELSSRPNTAAGSGSDSSRRNSTSTSAPNSINSNPVNSVSLELTSQASREWFPPRRRDAFWRARPLPTPPDMTPVHRKGSLDNHLPS